ncbi:MAG: hypothetical protein GY898_23015 [Proteobacteria bacterium]|nr:hypothetical protein [Pseudomonadota bacterium]
MASSVQTYIDTRGTEIVTFQKYRGRAPAQPGRFHVSDPAELRLLETTRLHLLEYVAGIVQLKDQADVDAERQAELERLDLGWIRAERQAAVDQIWIDQLNALGASPPLTVAQVEADYQANLAASRSSRRRRS